MLVAALSGQLSTLAVTSLAGLLTNIIANLPPFTKAIAAGVVAIPPYVSGPVAALQFHALLHATCLILACVVQSNHSRDTTVALSPSSLDSLKRPSTAALALALNSDVNFGTMSSGGTIKPRSRYAHRLLVELGRLSIDSPLRVETLVDLADDIYFLQQAESGGIALLTSPLDLNAIVAEVVDGFSHRFKARGATLTFKDSDRLRIIKGCFDATAIRKLLRNVLLISLKITGSGQVAVRAVENQAAATVGLSNGIVGRRTVDILVHVACAAEGVAVLLSQPAFARDPDLAGDPAASNLEVTAARALAAAMGGALTLAAGDVSGGGVGGGLRISVTVVSDDSHPRRLSSCSIAVGGSPGNTSAKAHVLASAVVSDLAGSSSDPVEGSGSAISIFVQSPTLKKGSGTGGFRSLPKGRARGMSAPAAKRRMTEDPNRLYGSGGGGAGVISTGTLEAPASRSLLGTPTSGNSSMSCSEAPMGVLIVDESAVSRSLTARTVKALSLSVTISETRNFEEAFVACLNSTFDLVIVDLDASRTKGEDLIRKIRGNGIEYPILALTSYLITAADWHSLTLLGGVEPSSKPVTKPVLARLLRPFPRRLSDAASSQRSSRSFVATQVPSNGSGGGSAGPNPALARVMLPSSGAFAVRESAEFAHHSDDNMGGLEASASPVAMLLDAHVRSQLEPVGRRRSLDALPMPPVPREKSLSVGARTIGPALLQPLAHPKLAAITPSPAASSTSGSVSSIATGGSGGGDGRPVVLLVDSDPVSRATLRRLVVLCCQCDAVETSNGIEAIKLEETVARIHGKKPQLPVVVVTDDTARIEAAGDLKSTLAGVLVRPVSRAKLADICAAHVVDRSASLSLPRQQHVDAAVAAADNASATPPLPSTSTRTSSEALGMTHTRNNTICAAAAKAAPIIVRRRSTPRSSLPATLLRHLSVAPSSSASVSPSGSLRSNDSRAGGRKAPADDVRQLSTLSHPPLQRCAAVLAPSAAAVALGRVIVTCGLDVVDAASPAELAQRCDAVGIWPCAVFVDLDVYTLEEWQVHSVRRTFILDRHHSAYPSHFLIPPDACIVKRRLSPFQELRAWLEAGGLATPPVIGVAEGERGSHAAWFCEVRAIVRRPASPQGVMAALETTQVMPLLQPISGPPQARQLSAGAGWDARK
ncbi:hypothetical protein HK405_014567 [Cladochytrium tenue]|nr:hypothetical protein HK405_014567 [Cladochytrium tenue]